MRILLSFVACAFAACSPASPPPTKKADDAQALLQSLDAPETGWRITDVRDDAKAINGFSSDGRGANVYLNCKDGAVLMASIDWSPAFGDGDATGARESFSIEPKQGRAQQFTATNENFETMWVLTPGSPDLTEFAKLILEGAFTATPSPNMKRATSSPFDPSELGDKLAEAHKECGV